MNMIVLSCVDDDFDVSFVDEGYPPEELEWRIIERAEELFPDMFHMAYYDEKRLPAVNILDAACKIRHRICFEYEQ
jgi:hypothetical protein